MPLPGSLPVRSGLPDTCLRALDTCAGAWELMPLDTQVGFLFRYRCCPRDGDPSPGFLPFSPGTARLLTQNMFQLCVHEMLWAPQTDARCRLTESQMALVAPSPEGTIDGDGMWSKGAGVTLSHGVAGCSQQQEAKAWLILPSELR